MKKFESPSDRLRQARLGAGFSTIKSASDERGLHKQNLADHEAGRRGISPDWAKKYARAFSVKPDWILFGTNSTSKTVPIVGYIGAGAELYPYDDHAKGASLDEIPAPPGSHESAVAVIVRGDSMFPIFSDGDIIIYSLQEHDATNFINRRCIVKLRDGRVMVKTLMSGSAAGLFILMSYNHPPIVDVALEWVAKIEWVQPR